MPVGTEPENLFRMVVRFLWTTIFFIYMYQILKS